MNFIIIVYFIYVGVRVTQAIELSAVQFIYAYMVVRF